MKTNIIYNESCIRKKGMRILPDKSIDMVLCDMPYGTTACKWDTIIPLEPLWEQLKRIIKPNGAIVLTASQPFTTILISSNMKMFRYCWVWEKSKATGFLNAKKRPLVAHEDIVVFYKKQPTYRPQMIIKKPYNKGIRKKQTSNDVYGQFNQCLIKSDGKRYPRSVLYIKTAESEGKVFHKTQKPVALMEYLIKTYTNEGEMVLDFAIGSGTTAVACINTNRKYIGFETNKDYCDITNKRLATEDTLFNERMFSI